MGILDTKRKFRSLEKVIKKLGLVYMIAQSLGPSSSSSYTVQIFFSIFEYGLPFLCVEHSWVEYKKASKEDCRNKVLLFSLNYTQPLFKKTYLDTTLGIEVKHI